MKRIFINSLILLLCATKSFAQEKRQFYYGIRALGMGNCAAAVVNDETALAQNPAGLGKLRDFFGTLFDPELELNQNAITMYNLSNYSNPFNLGQVYPAATQSLNNPFHARAQVMPSFVARNFGIGLLAKYNLDVTATAANAATTFYRNDLALLLGYNFRLFDGRVKIGFTGKMISRVEINDQVIDPTGAVDLPTLGASGVATSGVGIGADVGIILAAPWTMIPTLGVVVRDVGNTQYSSTTFSQLSTATTRPTATTQDADIALALFPIHRKNVRSVWTIEYKNALTASSETDKAKLIHAGFEVNLGDVFFIRGGYNQRYWTAGAELASERFQFQLASYGEEIGNATNSVEDRRYVGKMAFRF